MRSRAVVGLMVLVAGFTTERADARFRVCNQFNQSLSVSFGRVDRSRGWVAQGWWVVNPDQCTNIYEPDLDNRYYYVLAEPTAGGPAWKGGTVPFCVSEKSFLLYQDQYGKDTPEDCAKAGLRSAPFISVDVGKGEKNHVFTFSGGGSARPPVAAAPPSSQPPQPPQPPIAAAPRPPPQPAGSPNGTACQRYPNLC